MKLSEFAAQRRPEIEAERRERLERIALEQKAIADLDSEEAALEAAERRLSSTATSLTPTASSNTPKDRLKTIFYGNAVSQRSWRTVTVGDDKVKRPTMKDMTVDVLRCENNGLTTAEIVQNIKILFGYDIERSSLSPQLSRLKGDEVITLDEASGRWSLLDQGPEKENASLDQSREAPSN